MNTDSIENIISILSTLPKMSMDDLEMAFIISRLRHNRGNRTHTCLDLKISIRSLRVKMKMYAEEGYEIPAYIRRVVIK